MESKTLATPAFVTDAIISTSSITTQTLPDMSNCHFCRLPNRAGITQAAGLCLRSVGKTQKVESKLEKRQWDRPLFISKVDLYLVTYCNAGTENPPAVIGSPWTQTWVCILIAWPLLIGYWLCSPKRIWCHSESLELHFWPYHRVLCPSNSPFIPCLIVKKGKPVQQRWCILSLLKPFSPPISCIFLIYRLTPVKVFFAYVMSLNICAILQEVRHAKNCAKCPSVHPHRGGTDGNPRSRSCKLPVTREMAHTQLNSGYAN